MRQYLFAAEGETGESIPARNASEGHKEWLNHYPQQRRCKHWCPSLALRARCGGGHCRSPLLRRIPTLSGLSPQGAV